MHPLGCRSLADASVSLSIYSHTEEDEPVEEVFIRYQLNEVIELVPSVPHIHKLKSLLRGLRDRRVLILNGAPPSLLPDTL